MPLSVNAHPNPEESTGDARTAQIAIGAVGAILIVAGVAKLATLRTSVQLISTDLVAFSATTLLVPVAMYSILEVGVGVLYLLDGSIQRRPIPVLLGLAMVGPLIGFSAMRVANGIEGECGCFGTSIEFGSAWIPLAFSSVMALLLLASQVRRGFRQRLPALLAALMVAVLVGGAVFAQFGGVLSGHLLLESYKKQEVDTDTWLGLGADAWLGVNDDTLARSVFGNEAVSERLDARSPGRIITRVGASSIPDTLGFLALWNVPMPNISKQNIRLLVAFGADYGIHRLEIDLPPSITQCSKAGLSDFIAQATVMNRRGFLVYGLGSLYLQCDPRLGFVVVSLVNNALQNFIRISSRFPSE